jgi:hypothetical protein
MNAWSKTLLLGGVVMAAVWLLRRSSPPPRRPQPLRAPKERHRLESYD